MKVKKKLEKNVLSAHSHTYSPSETTLEAGVAWGRFKNASDVRNNFIDSDARNPKTRTRGEI